MTRTEQTDMARSAVALARLLADEPECDDALVDELFACTCVEAAVHLAAALLRDLPVAGDLARAYALHLAVQECEP